MADDVKCNGCVLRIECTLPHFCGHAHIPKKEDLEAVKKFMLEPIKNPKK